MAIALTSECELWYQDSFIEPDLAWQLMDKLVSTYPIMSRKVKMENGAIYNAQLASYIFTEPELVGFDYLPEVWGGRSAWAPELEALRDQIYQRTNIRFDVCRTLFYRNGQDFMDFHSDLPAYGPTDHIASVSLGAARTFTLRKTEHPEQLITLELEHGSLLMMGNQCQDLFEHSLPVDPDCHEPRLNITFRKFQK